MVVVWRVTEACDLGCAYCGFSRFLPRPRIDVNPNSVFALGRVLRDYAQLTGRQVLVSWLGGEPLKWPPLVDMSRVLRRDYHLSLSVTTNGTALSSERVRHRLAADFSELTLSLDGPPELHDVLRQSPGLYSRLRDNVGRLRELIEREGSRLRLRVNTVLMRDNVYDLEAFCRTAAGWGFESLTFNGLGGRDRPDFFFHHRLLPEQVAWLREALPGIRARSAELGLNVHGSVHYVRRLEASAAGERLSVGATDASICHGGSSFLFVDEKGRVSPCSHTPDAYGYSLAELQTPEALCSLPARWAAARQRHLAAACTDCPSTQVFGKFWYS